ncbi:winged helix-turn-helix transcriptional regulator [Amycolatopsis carbonis]|uniref:Winged helix-turn-helix transcriptional regulator n=1 Tax=Amycolatopsis carbonis TaxID=715471 RepID=A0A9Y2IA77_9PSEU|nr:winged helix-turn-helix transcriptional regulator [Amycolatopsis sp. 2-15]WIX76184.1 winged helix-turn-helix transcriptional regulator [Amycolatopsis sp. 2-15]
MDVESRTQTYGHYCLMAQTLDQLGDRWTLLVVRDLVHGPRRFTDLVDVLAGITPTTLTRRLRELEQRGILVADREPGRREVWYRLTPAGRDLVPTLEQLALWGLRNAVRPPGPAEPTHPEHLLWALRIMLDDVGAVIEPARWQVRVAGGESFVLGFDGERWTLSRGETEDPAVTVTTTRPALAKFLTGPPAARETEFTDLSVAGEDRAVRTMLDSIAVFPLGPGRQWP